MSLILNKISRSSPLITVFLKQPQYVKTLTSNLKTDAGDLIKYATAVGIFSLSAAYSKISKQFSGKKPVVKVYPKDTVILYQFPRGYLVPSISPYALKLETWCRAAEIKYQNELGMKTSSQGLIPFIQLNDYVVEDSQKCIEYLSKVFQKDLNSHLTEEQKAISRAVTKLSEDSLKWALLSFRFQIPENRKNLGLPTLALWYFSYRLLRATWYSNYGRFSKEELIEMAKKDLKALDTIIGKNKFLFSDSKPCDTDFAIFGLVAQILYTDKSYINEYLNTECLNLVRHVENIKQTYWKDWNDNIRITKKLRAKN